MPSDEKNRRDRRESEQNIEQCDCPICEDWKSGGKLYLVFFSHRCKIKEYYSEIKE